MAHSYADDSQVYFRIMAAAVQQFPLYVELIDRWMRCNRLELNTNKNSADMDGHAPTIVEDQYQRDQPTRDYSSFLFDINVSDLGVLLDSQLPVRRRIQVLHQNNYNVPF